jgi:hypothetical protein
MHASVPVAHLRMLAALGVRAVAPEHNDERLVTVDPLSYVTSPGKLLSYL